MKPHYGVAALLLSAAALVACGGGGASPFIAPTPAPLPSSQTASAAFSTTATTAVTLAAISNGSSAKVTLPAASVAANAKLTLQSSLPGGAVAPKAKSMAKAPSEIGGSNINVLDYVVLAVDQAVTISQTPAFSFTLPTAVSGNAYIAFFDVNNAKNGWTTILGPGTASGNTISFTAQTLVPSLSLQPNDLYVFALFTASGVATPTPVPTYPGAAGSAYAFTGSQTQTDVYTYPTPSPLPSTSVTSSVSEQINVGTTPFPSGTPATVDLHEVLTVAAPLSSQITTTDAWYGGALSGTSAAIGLYGTSASDNAGNSMSTFYTSPQIVDLVSETNGATWTNSPAGTTNATFFDGETLARTDNADGSFEETTTNALGYTFILSGKADGSGTYTGTGFSVYGLQGLAASAPSNGTITVSLTFPASPSPAPTPLVLATPKAWFTAGTPLYKESDTETTGVAYPASCNVPSQFGFSGAHIAQTIDRIDPMIGTLEHIVNDTYTSPVGPVCMTMSDTLTANYDYLLDTFSSYYDFADFSGNAVHTETINQSLTLQTAAVSGGGAAAQSSARATLSPAAIYASRAQFALKIENLRHRAMKATIKRIQANMHKGGLK